MSSVKPATSRVRLAYSEDFTTAPVVQGLDQVVKGATVRRCVSLSEVRDLARTGEAEVALVPTADALCLPNVSLIPCSAVTALGATRSFMLFSKKLPGEIKRVLVDQEDYGMTPLAKLLFPKKLMVRPEFLVSAEPIDPSTYDLMQNDGFDAYLLTGRNAIVVKREPFAFTWDMTLAWYEYSRLPFVVHCWIVKKGLKLGGVDKQLGELSRRIDLKGESAIKTAERMNVTSSSIKAIFEKGFFAEFNPNILTAIRRFGQELAQARVLPVQATSVYTEPAATKRPTGV